MNNDSEDLVLPYPGLYVTPCEDCYRVIEILRLADGTNLWRFEGESRAHDMTQPPHLAINWPHGLMPINTDYLRD